MPGMRVLITMIDHCCVVCSGIFTDARDVEV